MNSLRVRFLKHLQFLLDHPVIQSYPSAEFDKVFVAYVMSVGFIHPFLEQSVFESKDLWLTNLKGSIDEVVCRTETIFSILLDEREVLQVSIVIQSHEVE